MKNLAFEAYKIDAYLALLKCIAPLHKHIKLKISHYLTCDEKDSQYVFICYS